jgi:methionine biosynthesis protein MetW
MKAFLNSLIDKNLNYGRKNIESFLTSAHKLDVVLDVGAGHGCDLLTARRINPNAQLHGIEVYDQYVAELKQESITVHQLNLEKDRYPFADESVDVVIVNQVLEHVKELFYIFHEISRIVKVNGRVIVGVPNLASFHNRILLLLGQQPTCIQNYSAHVRGYTRSDLTKFWQYCFPGGYKVTAFKGSNFYPLPAVMANPLARLFPNLAWGIFFCLEKQKTYTNQFVDFTVNNQLETNFFVG